MQTVGLSPLCWHSRTEHSFSGNKGLHVRSGEAASCEPTRKTVQREGSLAKLNLCPQSPFFCFLSLARQRKRGLRRRTSFCGAKTKPSLEGFVLTKLKQDLCKRAYFCAAKRVPAPASRRKGEQDINGKGYLKFGKPQETLLIPHEHKALCN